MDKISKAVGESTTDQRYDASLPSSSSTDAFCGVQTTITHPSDPHETNAASLFENKDVSVENNEQSTESTSKPCESVVIPCTPTDKLESFVSATNEPNDYIYHVKWIRFRDRSVPIITQNENGPCPIIAITNVLLLRGSMTIPENTELLTGHRLVALLSEILLSHTPTCSDDGQLLNYETTVSDAFNLFPCLQTGLDINVRFTGVSSFEFTPALGVFDLFKIPLYHGWLVDPANEALTSAIGELTYNQLAERVIDLKSSSRPYEVAQGLLVEDFLSHTASQLTYHGLYELAAAVSSGQLAVFFRNNHYNTILKHQDRIYVLVTDLGLLAEPRVVWEMLNDVDGDTQFVDDAFNLYSPPVTSEGSSALSGSGSFTNGVKSVLTKIGISDEPTGGKTVSRVLSDSSSVEHAVVKDTLENACSDHSKVSTAKFEGAESDLDLVARLRSVGIDCPKQKVSQSGANKSVPSTLGKTDVKPSPEGFPYIYSEHVFAQAQRELGSGSDLDIAMRLQWAEMERAGVDSQTSVPSSSRVCHAPSPSPPSHPRNVHRTELSRHSSKKREQVVEPHFIFRTTFRLIRL